MLFAVSLLLVVASEGLVGRGPAAAVTVPFAARRRGHFLLGRRSGVVVASQQEPDYAAAVGGTPPMKKKKKKKKDYRKRNFGPSRPPKRDEEARGRARSLYDAARLLLRRGEAGEALLRLEAAVAADAHDAHSWLCLASTLRAESRVEDARRCFDAALLACPSSVHLAHSAGVAAAADGDIEMARDYFARALKIDERSAHARHSWASLEVSEGNPTRASAILGTPSAHDTPQIHVSRAELQGSMEGTMPLKVAASCYERRGDFESASHVLRAAAKLASSGGEEHARRALDLDACAASRVTLATILRSRGDVDGARSTLRGCLNETTGTRKDAHVAHRVLAKLELDDRGDAAAAQKVLEDALSRWPRRASLRVLAGSTAARLGQLHKARAHFESAVAFSSKKTSELAPSLTAYALFEAEHGQSKASLVLFDRAERSDPLHGATYAARADCEARRWSNPKAARLTLRRGLRCVRGNPAAEQRWAATLWQAWATLEGREDSSEAQNGRVMRRLLKAGLAAADKAPTTKKQGNKDDRVLLRHSLGSLELRSRRYAQAYRAFLGGGAGGTKFSPALLLGAARARFALDGKISHSFGDSPLLLSDDCNLALRHAVGDGEPALTSARQLFARAIATDETRDPSFWRHWALAEARDATSRTDNTMMAMPQQALSADARAVFQAALQRHPRDLGLLLNFADTLTRSKEAHTAKKVLLRGAMACAKGCPRLERIIRKTTTSERQQLTTSKRRASSHRRMATKKKLVIYGTSVGARRVATLLARLARLELRRDADAERYASAALAACHRSADAQIAVGACHEAAGRWPQAEAALQAAFYEAETLTSAGLAGVALAAVQLRRRAYATARHTLEDALLVAPGHAPLWHALAELEAKLGNIDGLANLHRRAKAQHFNKAFFFADHDSHDSFFS